MSDGNRHPVDTFDLDRVIERYHIALGALANGNPAVYKELFSRRDDVTLANPFAPFGPVSRGWAQVSETIERAATHYTDGELLGFETFAKHVTDQLARLRWAMLGSPQSGTSQLTLTERSGPGPPARRYSPTCRIDFQVSSSLLPSGFRRRWLAPWRPGRFCETPNPTASE